MESELGKPAARAGGGRQRVDGGALWSGEFPEVVGGLK